MSPGSSGNFNNSTSWNRTNLNGTTNTTTNTTRFWPNGTLRDSNVTSNTTWNNETWNNGTGRPGQGGDPNRPHDIGDNSGDGPFHNLRMAWPLKADTGDEMMDSWINKINSGEGNIGSFDFTEERKSWKKWFRTELRKKLNILKQNRQDANKYFKKCTKKLLQISAETGCIACDPNWNNMMYELESTGSGQGQRYGMTYNRNTQDQVR